MPWLIDPSRSRVGFSVKHMMVATVRGQFQKYSATIHLSPTDFARSRFEGEIEMASVDTGSADRDAELRTNEVLDVAHHPKLSFKSTRIDAKGGSRYVVRGDLTIRGVTRPVALDVEYLGTSCSTTPPSADVPSKSASGQVARIAVRGTVNRKDFGVSLNAVLEAGSIALGEKVKLELDIEAIYDGTSQAAIPTASA